MAIQSLGADGTTVQEIEAAYKAARVVARPWASLSWACVAAQTGLMASSMLAGATMFSFRNGGTNIMAIRRVGISHTQTVAFTTAQRLAYALFVARTFTVADSAGTQINLAGSNAKLRASFPGFTVHDMRISTTIGLTLGTRTLDANPLSILDFWVPGAGSSVPFAPGNMFSHDAGDHPLLLGPNEGFVIQNLVVFGAVGTGMATVNVELAELATF